MDTLHDDLETFLITVGTRSFPGVKQQERDVYHPSLSSAELKEKVSYTFTPLWAFVACSSVNFTFYLYTFLIVSRSIFLEREVFGQEL